MLEAANPVVAATANLTRQEPSFRDVYSQHMVLVWRLLRRMGVRAADLEDVCQEVFLVVHRRLPEFEGRSSIRTWLCGIAIRCASDYRNRAHIQRESPLESDFDRPTEATQHSTVERHEARAVLDRILVTLDPDKRAVFVLFEVEGLSMAEIADTVSCPLQTAYSRLYAAREHVENAVARLSNKERAS